MIITEAINEFEKAIARAETSLRHPGRSVGWTCCDCSIAESFSFEAATLILNLVKEMKSK